MAYQKTILVEELEHCIMVDKELNMFRSANTDVEVIDVTGWDWTELEYVVEKPS